MPDLPDTIPALNAFIRAFERLREDSSSYGTAREYLNEQIYEAREKRTRLINARREVETRNP